jgi:hypothetical protein
MAGGPLRAIIGSGVVIGCMKFGTAIEEYDALNELVGMLHFLDGLLAPLLCKHFVAPIVQQAIMQPVLIHRGELVA